DLARRDAAGLRGLDARIEVIHGKRFAGRAAERPAVAFDPVQQTADERKFRALHVLEQEGLPPGIDLFHDGRHLEACFDGAADTQQFAAALEDPGEVPEIVHGGATPAANGPLALLRTEHCTGRSTALRQWAPR